MHHIWKKFAGAGAAAAAALALSLLAAPVSADTAAEIVTAPPVATATTQPDDTQHSGWETVDGKRYYYDPETGEMQTGWLVLTNGSISRRYFFGEDGAVMTGFFRTDANTSPVYYADEEGAVVKGGIHTIDGKPYWVYEDGSLKAVFPPSGYRRDHVRLDHLERRILLRYRKRRQIYQPAGSGR